MDRNQIQTLDRRLISVLYPRQTLKSHRVEVILTKSNSQQVRLHKSIQVFKMLSTFFENYIQNMFENFALKGFLPCLSLFSVVYLSLSIIIALLSAKSIILEVIEYAASSFCRYLSLIKEECIVRSFRVFKRLSCFEVLP